jgi:asparagine synthase (glutamine-hydrolysing)
VECAAAIPSTVKRAGAGPIPLLRVLLGTRVAAAVMPDARVGEGVPQWLRRSLPAMVPSVLLNPRFDGRGIISRPALRLLWDEHCRGRHDHSLRFWSLLMLEFWFREFVDGDASEHPLEYAVLKAA